MERGRGDDVDGVSSSQPREHVRVELGDTAATMRDEKLVDRGMQQGIDRNLLRARELDRKALGIPGKDGMDGSMVCDAFLQGRIAEIAEYCKGDVERTRQIYKRMTFFPEVLAVGPELNEADITPPWEREAA